MGTEPAGGRSGRLRWGTRCHAPAAVILAMLAGCVATPPDGPVGSTGHAIVPVHFATDRAPEPSRPGHVGFSGLRGDGAIALGVAQVSIPADHSPGTVEQPAWWRFEFSEDPDRHVTILGAATMDRDAFIADLRAALQEASAQTALVFIHGYNVGFDDALRRTAQLSYDLRFPGTSLLYSWPSEGDPVRYTVDETNVAWTAEHLRPFLRLVLAEIGAAEVHVVAHSMGNRALIAALRDFDWDTLPDGSARLDQVVLAAPDIDAGHFRQSAPRITGRADRYTLYASSGDAALSASRRVHGYPRAGESGDDLLVIDGIDTIDASLVETDFVGHSYYGDSHSVISDLFDMIHNDAPPSERRWLHPMSFGDSRYWQLLPLGNALRPAQ